jgi:hypothetical protein
VAYEFHHAAEVVRDNYYKVGLSISSAQNVFPKAPSRVNMSKGMYREIPLPSKPILTRWGYLTGSSLILCQTYRLYN